MFPKVPSKNHPWRDYPSEHQRRNKDAIAASRANKAFVGGYIASEVAEALHKKSMNTGIPKTTILARALRKELSE